MATNAAGVLQRAQANPALTCVVIFACASVLIYVESWVWISRMLFLHGFMMVDLAAKDFVNYWLAARMTLDGSYQDLFVADVYFGRLQELFGVAPEFKAWSYPPHFLLFCWPLGYLGYIPALLVFLAATLALFIAAVAVFRSNLAPRSSLAILCFALVGYILMTADSTQNGFLTGAFMLFGFAWMKTRPMLAGLAFACLTVKPQLGLLIPVLLLFDRNWRAMFWAAAFTLALTGASVVIFGTETWYTYLTQTVPYQHSVLTSWEGNFLARMPSVYAGVRWLGFSAATAAIAQWPVSIVTAALLLWMLRRERDSLRRIFLVACGTFLILPYAFNYDMGALSAIAAMLASSDSVARNRSAAVVLAGVAVLAGIVNNLGRAGLPIAAVLLAAGLLTGLRRLAFEGNVLRSEKIHRQRDGGAEDQGEERIATQ